MVPTSTSPCCGYRINTPVLFSGVLWICGHAYICSVSLLSHSWPRRTQCVPFISGMVIDQSFKEGFRFRNVEEKENLAAMVPPGQFGTLGRVNVETRDEAERDKSSLEKSI